MQLKEFPDFLGGIEALGVGANETRRQDVLAAGPVVPMTGNAEYGQRGTIRTRCVYPLFESLARRRHDWFYLTVNRRGPACQKFGYRRDNVGSPWQFHFATGFRQQRVLVAINEESRQFPGWGRVSDRHLP